MKERLKRGSISELDELLKKKGLEKGRIKHNTELTGAKINEKEK